MKNNLCRSLFWLGLALSWVLSAHAYVQSGHKSTWPPGTIPMQIKLGYGATSERSNFSISAQQAMQTWNSYLGVVQFTPQIVGVGGQVDGVNDIYFAADYEGTTLGSGVLAVTFTFQQGNITLINQIHETDIVFNTFYAWDSYSGNLRSTEDLHRVALHELGHVLGLTHPDENGQSVQALMNSTASNLDHLVSDDISGGQSLYRAPGNTTPPGNDHFANAVAISLSSGTTQVLGNSFYATKESGEPDHDPGDGVGGASVWWKWTAPNNGSMTVDTAHSNFDTLLGVYTGNAVNALTTIGANDDQDPGVLRYSIVTFTASAGTTYYFAVDGWDAESGPIKLNLNFYSTDIAPTVSSPANRTVNLGLSAQFSVSANGTPYPNIQWQRLPAGTSTWTNLTNDGTYSGTTTPTLNVLASTVAMTGDQFRCIASNSAATATSLPATLYVNGPPAITQQPQNLVLNATQSGSLSVTVSSISIPSYQWFKNDVSMGTDGQSSSLYFGYLQPSDSGNYHVVVTNSYSSTTSNTVTVTVNELTGVVRVHSSSYNTLFQRTDGSWWFAGGNGIGIPPNSSDINLPKPLLTGSSLSALGQNPSAAVSGDGHYLFIKSDGSLWSYGSNSAGQLGRGLTASSSQLGMVTNNVTAIAAGKQHSLFLKTDGTLWSVGQNIGGQLADGTTTNRNTPVQIATDVVSMSTYYQMTLFVKSDGTLWAAGNNHYGNLGDGTTQQRLSPVQIATDVRRVAVGQLSAFFIKNDGSLWAMGANSMGQLGDGTTTDKSTPVQIATDVIDVTSNYQSAMFVKADHSLWSMGRNASGQLLNNTRIDHIVPTQVATNVADIAASDGASFMVKRDGSLWSAGGNQNGRLGTGVTTNNDYIVTQVASGQAQAPAAPTGLTATDGSLYGVIRLNWSITPGAASYEVWRSTSNDFGTASKIGDFVENPIYFDLTTTALVSYYYWVKAVNYVGSSGQSNSDAGLSIVATPPTFTSQPASTTVQLGEATSFTIAAIGNPAPTYQWQYQASGSSEWTNLVDNGTHTGTTSTTLQVSQTTFDMNGGQFRCMAHNLAGDSASQTATLDIQLPPGVSAVAATSTQGFFLRYDGTLWATNNSTRKLDQIASNVALISAGADHLMFIKSDQTLWGMGKNTYGQLGDGTRTDRATPVPIATGIVAAAAGAGHTLFIKSDGSLWATGENYSAQLIDGTVVNRLTPVQVAEDVRTIAAGSANSFFIRSDGTLWAIGYDNSGQLGDGGYNLTRRHPVMVASNVKRVTSNRDSSLYIKEDETLWMMGTNLSSHLLIDSQVSTASAGYYHFIYLKSNGELWGGGSNGSGQLGQGSGVNPIPTPVVQISSEVAAAAASFQGNATLFSKRDGSTWGTGSNLLGDGTTTLHWTPVQSNAGTVPLPDAVNLLSATSGATSGIRLFWTPAIGALHYDIYRSTTNDPLTAAKIGRMSDQSLYYDNSAIAGSEYYYWIRSVNPAGAAAFSDSASGMALAATSPVIAAQPSSITVTYGANAQLSVMATGVPNPWYQWQRFNTADTAWEDIDVGSNYTGSFSSVLTILSPASGAQFRCVVQNSASAVTSATVTLTVANGPAAPTITVQPQPQVVTFGANATFSIGATGPSLSYQWQILDLNGADWHNTGNLEIFNPGNYIPPTYSGMNSAAFTVNITKFLSGRQFRCRISNLAGIIYSSPASLTVVYPLPVITEHPQSQEAVMGSSVEFSVTVANDDPAISYQWSRNGVPILDAHESSFTLSNFNSEDTGNYTVVVTNSTGSVTSDIATLQAPSPPVIITHPSNQIGYLTAPVSFTVSTTTFFPVSYQWKFNGDDIPDATDSTFTITSVQASDVGDYTVVVTNMVGSDTSNAATLTLNLATMPAIIQQPADKIVVIGQTAGFSAVASGGPTPTYQWQAKPAGSGTWSNLSNGSAYSGALTNSLTISNCLVTNNGDQFRCVATNLIGAATSNAALLTVGQAGIVKVTAGRYHSARLTTTNQVSTTGFNPSGQLGDGTTTNITTPKIFAINGRTITDTAGMAEHSLFLTSAKEVWGTGKNTNGQLADSTTTNRSTPILMATDAIAIAAANFHSVILKSDGTMWTVGGNDSGQLGTGNTTDTSTLAQVATGVVDIAAGIRQTLFLKSDGTLWGMGNLDGSEAFVSTPIQIASNVKTMAAGGYHSLFVKTDGTLWAMGYNPYGQLGNGTTTGTTVPVQIATGVKSVAAGYFHSLFIKTDHTLWAMGYNSGGQLGDGTTTNRPTPIQVTTNVATVSASEAYTLFTKLDGSLWGTGYNAYGQFGNGGTATTTVPVQIASGALLSPIAPIGLSAITTAPYDRVQLNWTPKGNATAYEVWRSATNDSTTATRIATNLRWAIFEDLTTSLNQTYYYWTKSVNPSAASGFSAVASASTSSVMAQTITFTGPADQSFNATPITLSATASSGLTVTFSLVSGPATLNGNELTLTGPGVVTVRASQTGNASYTAASDVERSFTVSQASATVTLADLSATYDGNPHAVSATTNPAGLTVTFTYDGGTTVPTNAGSYAVVGTIDDETYNGNANGTLIIAKAAQTITFGALSDVSYSTTPITLSATTDSGLTVNFAVQSGPANLSGNDLTLTGTGSVTVRASQAGNTNYLTADPVDRSFTVGGNLQSWLTGYFDESELLDANISGPSADPDRDGLTNLLEYALGLDPKSADTTGLPEVNTTVTDWVYTYTRPTDRADLTYEVQVSSDLSTWSTTGVTHELVSTSGDVETWQATYPITSAANAFFRLKVTD